MSVTNDPSFKRYTANGVATSFTIPFLLLVASDLQVFLNNAQMTSGFTIAGLGTNAGTITFAAAPTGDLLLQRVVPFERTTDYQTNGDLLSQTVNRDFDRLWLAMQELRRDDGRALTVSLLEPEGIGTLPLRLARAQRVLAFDGSGNPVVSGLTLGELEQQPVSAAAAVLAAQQAASSASGFADAAGAAAMAALNSKQGADAAAAQAQQVASNLQGSLMPMFGVIWWPRRSSIPAGYVAADGQLLSRATYPAAWAAMNNPGNVPIVTDVNWLASTAYRGYYSAGDGSSTFRMPDYNGAQPGAMGAMFLRGGAGSGGDSVADTMQGHRHNLLGGGVNIAGMTTNTPAMGATGTNGPVAGQVLDVVTDGTNGTPRVGSETAPKHVTGVWVVKLFGAVTNSGSADAAQLASDLANLVARVQSCEVARQILHVQDQKASGVPGGTFTASAWRSRDLNTVVTNTIPGASLSANLITLPAGTYDIDASAPAFIVNINRARLNIGGTLFVWGTAEYSNASYSTTSRSIVRGRFTLTAPTVLAVEHWAQSTSSASGFGPASSSGGPEVYTDVKITRVP